MNEAKRKKRAKSKASRARAVRAKQNIRPESNSDLMVLGELDNLGLITEDIWDGCSFDGDFNAELKRVIALLIEKGQLIRCVEEIDGETLVSYQTPDNALSFSFD